MIRFALAACCFVVFAACNSAEPPPKARVVVSFLPLYCFAANVAGDRTEVETLLSGNISPHDYQFSPREMRKLNNADLLVTLGLGFEPWIGRVRENSKARIVEATTGLADRLIHGKCGHDHGQTVEHEDHPASAPNPHVWLDPQLAIGCVSNLTAALTALDPGGAAVYATNANSYMERLRSLDRAFAETLRPFAGTAVLTYHDALPYFTRRYNLTVAEVVQPVPEVNPSLRRIAELREVVRARKVRALLVDANTRSTLAERISTEFRIPMVLFDTLETGTLATDAYEKVMQNNVNSLARALK